MSSITYLQQNLTWQPTLSYSSKHLYNLHSSAQSEADTDLSIDKTDSSTIDNKFKTEMCNNFMTLGYCKYETRCRFAHGKHELMSKKVNNLFYKQKNCESFFTKGFCPYGSRCTFKHDERNLDFLQKPHQSKLTDLIKELKKNYDKFGFQESDPNTTKGAKEKRLSIFNDITDDQVSFNNKKITMKIIAKRANASNCSSILNQII